VSVSPSYQPEWTRIAFAVILHVRELIDDGVDAVPKARPLMF
jgi:hypothetical protein